MSQNSTLNNTKQLGALSTFWIGIVAIYASTVAYFSVWDTLQYVYLLPLLFLGFASILKWFYKRSQKVVFLQTRSVMIRESRFVFAIAFSIIFCSQMLFWFAYYPGGFNLDAYGQWDQVHGLMALNNWHPVLTTGLYWIITRVCDSFAFCIFVQLLVFSLSAAYLLFVLSNIGISRIILILASVYIAVCPGIGMNNVCLFKDVPFTIALIWMTVIGIRLIETEGKWLCSIVHSLLFAAVLIIIPLIRHNGIFYSFALLFCALLLFRKEIKQLLAVSAVVIFALLLVEGPVFKALSVEHHGNFVGESVGIPMAIMANAYVTDRENTPKEVQDFLLSIADESAWEEKYELGEWDSCKWDFGGTLLFEGESLSKFVKLTAETIYSLPEAAYESFRENTRVVWQVLGFSEWDTWVYIEPNDYGIVRSENEFCSEIVGSILSVSLSFLGCFFCWNIGVPTMAFLWLSVYSIARKEYGKLLLCVPPVIYNLCTMLFLCGPSHRYFYFNHVLAIPVIVYALYSQAMRQQLPEKSNKLNHNHRPCRWFAQPP